MKQLNWQLPTNPNCLRIFTLDAFCSYLVRQMPITSKLGCQTSIIQDQEVANCYQEAAEQLYASRMKKVIYELERSSVIFASVGVDALLVVFMKEKGDLMSVLVNTNKCARYLERKLGSLPIDKGFIEDEQKIFLEELKLLNHRIYEESEKYFGKMDQQNSMREIIAI